MWSLKVKVIQMSVKIGEHDMRTKTKQVSNWVAHGAEVRVAIIGSPETKDELLVSIPIVSRL